MAYNENLIMLDGHIQYVNGTSKSFSITLEDFNRLKGKSKKKTLDNLIRWEQQNPDMVKYITVARNWNPVFVS